MDMAAFYLVWVAVTARTEWDTIPTNTKTNRYDVPYMEAPNDDISNLPVHFEMLKNRHVYISNFR